MQNNSQLMNCLYTEQKLKKRKRYCDGVVKTFSNTRICSLYATSSSRELDSRVLSKSEIEALTSGKLEEIEFENYLVQLDNKLTLSSANPVHVMSYNKVFKPPSKINKPLSSITESAMNAISPLPFSLPISNTKKQKYDIVDSELNMIWNQDDKTEFHSEIYGFDESNPSISSSPTHQEPKNFSSTVLNPILSSKVDIWGDSDDS